MVTRRTGRLLLMLFLALAMGATGCDDEKTNADVNVEPEPTPDPNPEPIPEPEPNPVPEPIPVLNPDPEPDDEPACSLEDDLAPNYGPDEAADLGTDVDREGLFICSGANDWYRFELEEGQNLLIFVEFAAEFGDLDIYVYEEGATTRGQELAVSGSPNQSEFIDFLAPATGTYLLEVEGFEGAENQYRLFAKLGCSVDSDCPVGTDCFLRGGYCEGSKDVDCGFDEEFEPNESARAATPIEPPTALGGVSICPEDTDYYRVDVPAESGLLIDLAHPGDENVDALLFNTEGRFFGQGQDQVGGESFQARFLPAGEYIILIDQTNNSGAAQPISYDLSVVIEAGTCTQDQDCTGVPGREFCDIDAGVCEGIDSEGGQGLGDPCDDDNDCNPNTTDGCYEGSAGSGDNVCTIICQDDNECGAFGEGAYCFPIDRFRGISACVAACTEDFDCTFGNFCDTESGRCESSECGIDTDCPRENEACIHADFRQEGLCLDYAENQNQHECGVGEAPDDGDNGSSSRGQLLDIADNSAFIEGLSICDADEDWFVVELTETSSNLTVDVEWDGSADIDVYIFGEDGRQIGAGTEPDANPEQALSTFLTAGRYFVRVNKFPIDGSDPEVSYAIQVNIGTTDCRNDEEACNDTQPLRIACNEETGACTDFEGNGEVEMGGLCDTRDDCVEEADFCLTFQGADDGRNICSHFCDRQNGCDDLPGTQCFAISRTRGICAFP